MSDSEQEADPEPKRGRPRGQADASKRYRRTDAEISQDKIRVAEMRLLALRETEERKLPNKRPRTKIPKVQETPVKDQHRQHEVVRDESPPTPRVSIGRSREALYGSWFQQTLTISKRDTGYQCRICTAAKEI